MYKPSPLRNTLKIHINLNEFNQLIMFINAKVGHFVNRDTKCVILYLQKI